MGRRTGINEIVVDQVIGPGPNARHERYRFEPDIHWQHAQIADHYYATGGTSTYLGGWHSHPEATHGRLSSIDRKALRTIISEPEAQCPKPLMVIFLGKPRSVGSRSVARQVATQVISMELFGGGVVGRSRRGCATVSIPADSAYSGGLYSMLSCCSRRQPASTSERTCWPRISMASP